MAPLNFLHKRTNTADKRPDPNLMAFGELNINYDTESGGVFYKDTLGNVVKVGPVQVGSMFPNELPAGSEGNSLGELWFDIGSGNLKIWDGSEWTRVTNSTTHGGVF